MPTRLSKDDLIGALKHAAKERGMHCTAVDHEGLRADLETTSARWLFGGRKVTYHFGCRLEEQSRTMRFREAVTEEVWGIPAPFFWGEKTQVSSGGELSGTRTEHGPGAGGPLEYHRIRHSVEQFVKDAGWTFIFEKGQRP
jgi:hypothetical protein